MSFFVRALYEVYDIKIITRMTPINTLESINNFQNNGRMTLLDDLGVFIE